jgi:hypothetical protein
MILMAVEGATSTVIAERLGIGSQHTVGRWRKRFASGRVDCLFDEPRPGAPRTIGDDEIAETIRRTLKTTPADPTHWSLSSLAKTAGLAPSTIHRIWKAFGLQPHPPAHSSSRPIRCLSKRRPHPDRHRKLACCREPEANAPPHKEPCAPVRRRIG